MPLRAAYRSWLAILPGVWYISTFRPRSRRRRARLAVSSRSSARGRTTSTWVGHLGPNGRRCSAKRLAKRRGGAGGNAAAGGFGGGKGAGGGLVGATGTEGAGGGGFGRRGL